MEFLVCTGRYGMNFGERENSIYFFFTSIFVGGIRGTVSILMASGLVKNEIGF